MLLGRTALIWLGLWQASILALATRTNRVQVHVRKGRIVNGTAVEPGNAFAEVDGEHGTIKPTQINEASFGRSPEM